MATTSRSSRTDFTPLRWHLRAELFSQLAAMEKSGLPTTQALGLLHFPAPLQTRVTMAQKLFARGIAIAEAGRRSGLFTDLETNLIAAATSAGSPAMTYRRLADYYTARAAQARAMKSRMMLPGLLLVSGIFIQPLPALFGGTMSGGRYLWHCLSPLLAIAAGVAMFIRLAKVQEGPPSPVRDAVESLLLHLPLFGKMLIQRNIRDYFESLALMLEAGMPILQALPKALETVRLHVVHTAFESIQSRIESGDTLTQALTGIRFLDNSASLALINTGEESGSLPEMLFRYANMETAAINHFNKQVADWLPRIIYTGISAWVAYGILTGNGAGPNLPEELR